MTRRHVIVIHYFFPPLGGAGVPRVLKFVKYLPELGWDVTVVTSGSGADWYGVRDQSLLADVPAGVRIVRCPEIPIARIRQRLANPLHRLGVPQVAQYLGWPDVTAGWAPSALAATQRLVRRSRPDVVLSSSFPYSAHLVALAAKRTAGVPWVADFRDPWTLNPQSDPVPAPLLRVNAWAERTLVAAADRVTVVDDRLELVGLRHDDRRRAVIPNGVDEEDVDPPTNDIHPPSGVFRLTYVGSLYADRDAAPVLRAIRTLLRNGTLDPSRFELSIVGNVWLRDGLATDGTIPIRLAGFVDRERAFREMREATALLFYAPASTWAPSGKIFEYLTSGRPILSVARRDNLAYRLVQEMHAGVAVEPDDPAGIERGVAELFRRWSAGALHVGTDVRAQTLARYSRRRLTAELAQTLEAAANGKLAAEP